MNMGLSAQTALFPLHDSLRFLMCILFAVFAFIWYAKKPTRGRFVFSLGWALATLGRLASMPILQQYEALASKAHGPQVIPGELDPLMLVGSLLEVVRGVPPLVIALGFLLIILNDVREAKKGYAP